VVRDEEKAMLVKRALQAAAPDLKELAEEGELNYGTMRAWSAGARTPGPDNLKRIAALLDRRADTLRGLAVEVRRAANDGSPDNS
jgi:hypothetical protein